MNNITIQNPHRFKEIKSYQKFQKEKAKIQKKYASRPWDLHDLGQGNIKDKFTEEWWSDWQNYKKELLDIMLKPNSSFQQFVWDIESPSQQLKAERAIIGYDRSIYYNG